MIISIHDRSLETFSPEGRDRIYSIPGPSGFASPPTLHRGQIPQNQEKRVSESENPHFPSPQKRAFRVKKSPFSLWCPVKKWGFFDSNCPFPGSWAMGVFRLRNPLFLILGILTPVQGRGVRNLRCVQLAGFFSNVILANSESTQPLTAYK